MSEETQDRPAVEGEWECGECEHVILGSANKVPTGSCPECGEAAENSFSFYAYDDDWDSGWDDDGDDGE